MTEIIDPVWTCSEAPEEPGEEITLEGWAMSYGAGGCLRASGTVNAETARRCRQGTELKAYVGGRCVWSGPISASPLVYRGKAELAAEGWVSKAVKASGRLLYQSRDVTGFLPAGGPPWNAAVAPHLPMDQSGNQIDSNIAPGTVQTINEQNHLNFAASGTPGGLTRIRYDWVSSVATSTRVLQTYGGTYPADVATQQGSDHLLNATSGLVNQTITGGLDTVAIVLRAASTLTQSDANRWMVIYNIRVNGITDSDTFTTSQIVTDILGRLGFDTSQVQSSGVNALPYDLKDGSWFSGLEYMAFLDDRPVVNIVPADDGTRMGIYRPWGKVVHDISLENAEPVLNSLPLYNGVTVSYPHVGGFTAEVTIRPSDIGASDPLAGTDADNILAISLSDAQPLPDATLATAQGQAVMARLLNAREEGTFVIPSLMPGDVLHGDHLNVSDYGPLEARELPIDAIEFRQGQPARVSIYSPGGELGLAARFGLQQARLIQNPALPAIDVMEQELENMEHEHCHGGKGDSWHHGEKHTERHTHLHNMSNERPEKPGKDAYTPRPCKPKKGKGKK